MMDPYVGRTTHRSLSQQLGLQGLPRQGFSLLEVLLAVAVLGMGLSALMFVFSESARSAQRVAIQTDLHLLGQMRMAQIEAGELDPAGVVGEGTFDRKPGYVWTVALDDADPVGLLRRVSVTVRWAGEAGDVTDGPDLTITRLLAQADTARQGNDSFVGRMPLNATMPKPPKLEDIAKLLGNPSQDNPLANVINSSLGRQAAPPSAGQGSGPVPPAAIPNPGPRQNGGQP